MGMRLREFAGAVTRCHEVLVLVDYGPGDEQCVWLPIAKTVAKEIIDAAKADGLEEIDAVMQDGDLMVGMGDEGEVEETETVEGEEEEEEEAPAAEEKH